jgi:hypothetical protein
MTENENIINYFNGNNLLISTPEGKEYGGISAWQGIRSLGSNIYLICGTTNPTANTGNGLIYIGNINCENGEIYYLNVPNSLGTSIYGPNYNKNNGIYTFVGSYLDNNQNTNGFVYQGNLNDLLKESNFIYPTINKYFNINFFHSFSNNLFVGNSGNSNEDNETVSYIYDMNDLSKIKTIIKYPNSSTTTTYGIWYNNNNNNYTIVGGYSMNYISINKIYSNNIIYPIGNSFIADYNYETNTFSNWTTIDFGNNLLTHFQGISENSYGTYSINADVIDLKESLLPTGYFLTIDRNIKNEFIYNLSNSVKILYNINGISSSNSVADNKIVGLYIGNDNTKISYQAEIINNSFISKSNINDNNISSLSIVKKDQIIKFNNTFLENNYINYNEGIFTFLEYGTYFISFNIYIENTTLPSVNLNIEYTMNSSTDNILNLKNQHSFLISQKGIDEFGTGTAHSLTLPCSFINKFTLNDTLKIRNTSNGDINFISNYVKNATNGIISIYKIA